jgi:hypothetical protein
MCIRVVRLLVLGLERDLAGEGGGVKECEPRFASLRSL